MGIHREWGRHLSRWRSTQPQREYINSDGSTVRRIRRSSHNRYSDFILRQLGLRDKSKLHNNDSRRGVSIRTELPRTRGHQPDPNTKSHHRKIRYGYNKYVYPVIAALLSVQCLPSRAEVGGVSATANPIANSSGSVTNQAIQVLQGPYITNTYGGGVQCQGSTFNVTPYIQFADSRKDPWVDFYNEPQYNLTDTTGKTTKQTVTVKNYPWEDWYDTRTKADGSRWFEDGEDIQIEMDIDGPDGVPDVVNTGGTMTPTWYKPIRTDMSANQSFNAGVSATLSIPLNRKLVKQCHEAAQAQINHQNQLVSNKRLDFELARLKNCGELKKAGIFFHPASPYHSVCADVVVTAAGGQIIPHEHQLPQPKWTQPKDNSTSSSSASSVEVIPSSNGTGLPTLQIGTVSESDDQVAD